MKLEKINEYLLILYDLYYLHSQTEHLGELYLLTRFYNKDFTEVELKDATLLLLKRGLADGTHFIKLNNYKNSTVFSKKNKNVNEGINLLRKYWKNIEQGLNDWPETTLKLDNGNILNYSPYLYWTEEWKNELCQLCKIGHKNEMSSKCKFNPNYQYQMPKNRFIPDNDCNCED